MVQVYIMWGGIATIFWFVTERWKNTAPYFWEYTLVVVLLTVGLILTVEAIKRSRLKGQQK